VLFMSVLICTAAFYALSNLCRHFSHLACASINQDLSPALQIDRMYVTPSKLIHQTLQQQWSCPFARFPSTSARTWSFFPSSPLPLTLMVLRLCWAWTTQRPPGRLACFANRGCSTTTSQTGCTPCIQRVCERVLMLMCLHVLFC